MNKIVWYEPKVNYLLNNYSGPVGRHLAKKAYTIAIAAKAQVGKKTGKLANSIKVSHERYFLGQAITVTADAIDARSGKSYAWMHHEGTRPHVILPVIAPQLVFVNRSGRLVRTNRVNHPGTKPNRYLSDNLPLALI